MEIQIKLKLLLYGFKSEKEIISKIVDDLLALNNVSINNDNYNNVQGNGNVSNNDSSNHKLKSKKKKSNLNLKKLNTPNTIDEDFYINFTLLKSKIYWG